MPELSPAAGQQPHDDCGAPADEGTCPVEEPQCRKAVRLVHVTGSFPQQAGIVLVETEPAIAAAAQKAADVAALMVVIDAEPLGVFQLADFADAPLPRQHALVVFRREAVDIPRPVLAGLRTYPLAVLWIRIVFQPLPRVDFLAVPAAPGAIGCEHFLSKHRILGISLLSSLGGAGRHRSLLLICARWDRSAPRQACVGRRWRVRDEPHASGEGPNGRPVRERWVRGAARRSLVRRRQRVAPVPGRRKPRRHRRSTRSCREYPLIKDFCYKSKDLLHAGHQRQSNSIPRRKRPKPAPVTPWPLSAGECRGWPWRRRMRSRGLRARPICSTCSKAGVS
jgi:hypothetical protein